MIPGGGVLRRYGELPLSTSIGGGGGGANAWAPSWHMSATNESSIAEEGAQVLHTLLCKEMATSIYNRNAQGCEAWHNEEVWQWSGQCVAGLAWSGAL